MEVGIAHRIYELLLSLGVLLDDVEWVFIGVVCQGVALAIE